MNVLTLEGVAVRGIAACVPANAVANDGKIVQATGIVTRRIATPGTTVVDLCVRAAKRVLADTGATPDEFGAVICVSFTQHDRMPCAAVQAQARLGLPKGIIAFDVMLACSGWGYGLYLAGSLARQTGKKVLLLDGDVQSAFVSGDKGVEPLLADGGTATVVERSERDDVEPWRFAFVADGAKGDALRLAHGEGIRMDGFGVFRFVATDVVNVLKEFLRAVQIDPATESNGLSFVPHQPNVYMVRQLAKSLGLESRVQISCDRLGNLSSASVPTTIVSNSVRGRVLLSGFGGGLSVSVGLLNLGIDCTLTLVDESQDVTIP